VDKELLLAVGLDEGQALEYLSSEADKATGGLEAHLLDLGCGGQVDAEHDGRHDAEQAREDDKLGDVDGNRDGGGEQNDGVDTCR
jgi:hypothetical protein